MTLLPPNHPDAPKYWRNEMGGELQPAIQSYLMGEPPLTIRQLQLIRAYLTQWVNSPAWADPVVSHGLAWLRLDVAAIRNRADIDRAVNLALDLGMDPL